MENEYFRSVPDPRKVPYTIILPPPNSNNSAHCGHALNFTFQDILIRYKRLQGYNTCWINGTDHGGISSVQLFNKYLITQNRNKYELTPEQYHREILDWIHGKRDIIISQMKKLGLSCDWSREQFTMSPKSSFYVNSVFKELYEKGLIYRGSYMINQCVRCCTALSNDEVEHIDHNSKLYYIRYKLSDQDGYIIVATTRPETLLGDTAIACNPSDDRYLHLIGKYAIVPLTNRKIPIIADNYVKPEFGTGLVKITPSHDKNDYDVAKRHNLPFIDVIDKTGKIQNTDTKFDGLDRFNARIEIIKRLSELNQLDKQEEHDNKLGICYRCKNPIESIISTQWFLKTGSLREQTMKMVNNGEIKFTPEHHVAILNRWMEADMDWCISRQNWGHPIPIWNCQDCMHQNCDVTTVKTCSKCSSTNLTIDGDFLDTWFSSALWAFSVFDSEEEFNYYFPSDVLVTGSDILFFWVARMIMMTSEIKKSIPFKHVYLHGIVRDADGVKMSKTLGNGIDPMTVIEQYSADILRFTMIYLTPTGQDTNIGMDDFKLGQTFCTKLWNCVRYVLTNIGNYKFDPQSPIDNLTNIERWIINKLNSTIKTTGRSLDSYNFADAVKALYAFVWDDLCNCYLEYAKSTIDMDLTRRVLLIVINSTLKLLHPFIPFLTDELHQMISKHFVNYDFRSLMDTRWPNPMEIKYDHKEDELFKTHTEMIKIIRTVKSEYGLTKSDSIDLVLISDILSIIECIKDVQPSISRICHIGNIGYGNDSLAKNTKYIRFKTDRYHLYFPIDERFDINNKLEAYKKRIRDNISKISKLTDKANIPNISPKKVAKFNKEIDEIKKQNNVISQEMESLIFQTDA
jgi:valyl-tRNA synthetase